MQTKVKPVETTITIAELAGETNKVPGQIYGVLADLGVQHDFATIEAEEDEVELIREAINELPSDAVVHLLPGRTPRDMALALGKKQPEVQKLLMTKLKTMAQLTTSLKDETIVALAGEYGYKVEWLKPQTPKAKPSGAAPVATGNKRPPVITIMGHVDHGKTSLLDYIRKANVAAKEHGGITQHIGAYQVSTQQGLLTFLDTPGHAAFTAMRARGAQVTDIAVLVVAADDGIMPQTIEAIDHAKNAEVPIVVAINKVDRPDANPDKVKSQLTEHEVIAEEFGGDVITVPVSAITGQGVDELLEMLTLRSDLMNLEADPKGDFSGTVIEAKLDKGRGPVATVLVQSGTLQVGSPIVVGRCYGKVRALVDYLGEKVASAGPSVPVEILGLSDVPEAGEQVELVENEKIARQIAEQRMQVEQDRIRTGGGRRISLGDLRDHMDQTGQKTLNLIVRADVQGSVEAVKGLLEETKNEEVEVRVIHSGVGPVTESDILLASAASAICVGFNVKPEGGAKKEAERAGVEVRTYRIIYELIEDIEKAVKGMLEPKFEESYQGTIEVRAVFNLSRYGKVAGSHVTDGKVTRNSRVRVRRDKELVYEGQVESLKHFKEDVKEMAAGFDCGLQFVGWSDFLEGDVVEAYELVQIN